VISVLGENSAKLILAIVLVLLGFGVIGALTALFVGVFFGWLISRKFIEKYILKQTVQQPNLRPIVIYSIPVIFQFLTITSLYSSDVVLVKHFFSSHEAGIYAAVSTMGRIIFFGASPITAVMFPLVSSKYSKGQTYKKVFILSLSMTTAVALSVLFVYLLLPGLSIKLLYGAKYLEAKPLLLMFGIFSSLLTIANLMINYYLSLGRVKVIILSVIAAVLQIVGIIFYHESLTEVITLSIIITTLLVASLFVYFAYENYLESKISLRHSSGLQKRENNSQRFKDNKKRLR
jgi:O-antigen/teichoic acid export membrane protein